MNALFSRGQPEVRPPVPPFSYEDAVKKVRAAEDGWNGRDPAKVKMAYTADTKWRNRAEIFSGREKVQEFLTRKWDRELDYRLIKEYWAHTDDKIGVSSGHLLLRRRRLRFASPMNIATTRATGTAPTATRCGTLTRTAL